MVFCVELSCEIIRFGSAQFTTLQFRQLAGGGAAAGGGPAGGGVRAAAGVGPVSRLQNVILTSNPLGQEAMGPSTPKFINSQLLINKISS